MRSIFLLFFVFSVAPLLAQNGNVGIGTNIPNQKLEVAGWIELGNQTEGTTGTAGSIRYHSVSQRIQYHNGTTWIDLLPSTVSLGDDDWLYSSNNIYNGNTGNVGVGTTTFTEKFNVGGDLKIFGSGSTIGLSNVANGSLVIGSTLGIDDNEIMFNAQANVGTVGAQDLLFVTNGTSRMTVDATGNVGVGIAPLTKLHINGSIRGDQSGAIRISSPTGYVDVGSKNASWTHFNTDRPAFYFDQPIVVDDGAISSYDENLVIRADYDAATSANQLYLVTTGNVGVGIAPDPLYKLDVNGDLMVRGSDIFVGTGGEKIFVTGDDLRLSSNSGYIDVVPADGSHGLILRDYTGATSTWSGLRTVEDGTYDRLEFSINNSTYGAGLVVRSDNRVGIGITTPGYSLHVAGKIKSDGITETSDERLKTNITLIDNALPKLMLINGVSYNWRVDEYPQFKLSEGTELGVIAQEVAKVFPEVVNTDDEGYLSVEYSHLVPVLIQAIKEQQLIIDQYKAQLGANTELLQSLQTQLNLLQQDLNTLKANNTLTTND